MTPILIMTRPEEQGASFAASVVAGWEGPLDVIAAPLIAIVPMDADPGHPDGLVFTSTHGVEAAIRLGLRKGLPAWCVGANTATAARDAGFSAVAGPGDADRLVDQIIAAGPQGQIAHLRGRHARGDVAGRLEDAGIRCADVIVYDQVAQPLQDAARRALAGSAPVIVPLFSPRTATIFATAAPSRAPLAIVAISAAVCDAASAVRADKISVADHPNAGAMLAATLDLQAWARRIA